MYCFRIVLMSAFLAIYGCTDGAKKLERSERTHVRKVIQPERKVLSAYRIETSVDRSSVYRKLSVEPNYFNSNVSGAGTFELGMHFEDASVMLSRNRTKKVDEQTFKILNDLSETIDDLGLPNGALKESLTTGKLPDVALLDELYRSCTEQLSKKGGEVHIAIMQVGNWIEHMYLVMFSKEFKSAKLQSDFIALNKLAAHNLLMTLVEQGNVQETDAYINDLNRVIKLLDKFSFSEEELHIGKGVNGEYLITGGAVVETDETVLADLRDLITSIRSAK